MLSMLADPDLEALNLEAFDPDMEEAVNEANEEYDDEAPLLDLVRDVLPTPVEVPAPSSAGGLRRMASSSRARPASSCASAASILRRHSSLCPTGVRPAAAAAQPSQPTV